MKTSIIDHRINLLTHLGEYLQSNDDEWQQIQKMAALENSWFQIEDIKHAINSICNEFLNRQKLEQWIKKYPIIFDNPENKHIIVGIVFAGNIPLVGFHDFLCAYISGFSIKIKLSKKDTILWCHILEKIIAWDDTNPNIEINELLKNCTAYIATGSNNSARYFDYYFAKYPHIIRKNKTSVAILDGFESDEELNLIVDDITSFYGLGCRNVTHLYLPHNYQFEKLFKKIESRDSLITNNKFKNNYDYNLALLLLNKAAFSQLNNMLVLESDSLFAPIASLHYTYYTDLYDLITALSTNEDIQAIIVNKKRFNIPIQSDRFIGFGKSQSPSLTDYADGTDTMQFLQSLIVL